MKPAPFDYHRPETLDEAMRLCDEHGDDVKVLAGGQSLVPMLNFRLARPAHLVDLERVSELAFIRRSGGTLSIGAMTRQSVLEASPVVASHWPLLTAAVRWVGHPQIRNRGTVGGSIAHADPAAELPVAFATLDARFVARSVRGTREVGWREFFVTHLTTSLEPEEVLVEIRVPAAPEGSVVGFSEFARRHGDFALGGAAVVLDMDGDVCREARIGLLAAADRPLRAEAAESMLAGARLDERATAEAARLAVEDVSPTGDLHGDARYRRELIEAMVRRALGEARDRARKVVA